MSDTENTTPPAITHADAETLRGIMEEVVNEATYNPNSMLSEPRMRQGYDIAAAASAATQGQP